MTMTVKRQVGDESATDDRSWRFGESMRGQRLNSKRQPMTQHNVFSQTASLQVCSWRRTNVQLCKVRSTFSGPRTHYCAALPRVLYARRSNRRQQALAAATQAQQHANDSVGPPQLPTTFDLGPGPNGNVQVDAPTLLLLF